MAVADAGEQVDVRGDREEADRVAGVAALQLDIDAGDGLAVHAEREFAFSADVAAEAGAEAALHGFDVLAFGVVNGAAEVAVDARRSEGGLGERGGRDAGQGQGGSGDNKRLHLVFP